MKVRSKRLADQPFGAGVLPDSAKSLLDADFEGSIRLLSNIRKGVVT